MWTYSQSTGRLSRSGKLIGTGYSGHGEGLNNHSKQDVLCIGPIPCGSYSIGPEFTHPTTGPLSMRLMPLMGTDTFGRSGFLMHGDNSQHDDSASEGCIVISENVRRQVSTSPDRTLLVAP